MWFAIDTLEYLRRGGRIGGARAWIGSRPEDQADPHPRGGDHPGRAGPHPRPLARAAARLRPPAPRATAPTAGSSSTSRTTRRPTALVDDCREIFGCEPVFVSEIGAVLGAHVGPGLLGVGSVSTELASWT